MGEVTNQAGNLFAILIEDNAFAPEATLRMYADALWTYAEAAANVARLGAVCSHPKTGAPMENPYLSVQDAKARLLRSLAETGKGEPRMRTERAWRAATERAGTADGREAGK